MGVLAVVGLAFRPLQTGGLLKGGSEDALQTRFRDSGGVSKASEAPEASEAPMAFCGGGGMTLPLWPQSPFITAFKLLKASVFPGGSGAGCAGCAGCAGTAGVWGCGFAVGGDLGGTAQPGSFGGGGGGSTGGGGGGGASCTWF